MEKATPTFSELLVTLGRQGHAAHALWVASNLESVLAKLIASYMPKLDNALKGKLFKGYGPLSSFNARIDVAYALDLIPESLHRELHIIREIRNAFAHSPEFVHFDTKEMVDLLKKFPDYRPEADRLQFFTDKLNACFVVLNPQLEVLALVAALKAHGVKQTPSPEKSRPGSPQTETHARDDS